MGYKISCLVDLPGPIQLQRFIKLAIMNFVSKIIRRGVILLALLAVGLLSFWATTRAQNTQDEIFPTGHRVDGKFKEKFYSAKNPLLIYGYPITEPFVSVDGKTVQYFTNARMELDGNGEIQLTPLGEWYAGIKNELNTGVDAQGACKSFAETDKVVCYNFQEFFDNNGGVSQFGLPVTNYIQGKPTHQYFQYAMLEYHPEYVNIPTIAVAKLGEKYFYAIEESLTRLDPPDLDNAINNVVSLEVKAFVSRDPAAQIYEPTLYVIVRDQALRELENASVEFVVRYADGKEERYIMDATNRYGFSRMQFPVGETTPGIVEIFVKATFSDFVQETRTSFRVWY